MTIEFWFEFASTYSYLAAMRVEEAARRRGKSLVWRAFMLGPIMRSVGWNDSPFNLYPVKGRYMWRDMERVCASLNLAFRKPSVFPRNGLTAARIACAFEGALWVPGFVRAVYTANFVEDADISDPAVLRRCLAGYVDNAEAAFAAANSAEVKTRLRANTERAVWS